MFHIAAMITPTWQRATAGPDSPRGVFNMQIHLKILRKDYHYDDVIMGSIASQITSLTIIYSTVYSGPDQRKHQSPASLAFPAQMASNTENVSIWWRHHDCKNMNIWNKYELHIIKTTKIPCQELDLSGHTWPFLCTQRTHDAIITPLLRQNDVTTSFWCNNNVIIASCVRWADANLNRTHLANGWSPVWYQAVTGTSRTLLSPALARW